jgi:SAM-dependent methyltransferase
VDNTNPKEFIMTKIDKPFDFSIYVCPMCKSQLELKDVALICPMCQVTYPIVDCIPDFILEDLTRSTNPVFRSVKSIDRLARIYETKLWYPVVLKLFGGLGAPSLEELASIVTGMVEIDKGLILDVACGPGTFGRRIASLSKLVYGIDISIGMLRQGVAYIKRDHIPNVHFARAKVEALPFQDVLFDAALCGGALHLFADTVSALREICRTMKEGAPLAVFTFFAGNGGLLRFRRIREHVQQDHGVHVFEIPELEQYLVEAGFESFQPQVYGSILLFSARKRRV